MVCNFVCGSIPRTSSHLDTSSPSHSLLTLFTLSSVPSHSLVTLSTPLSHSLHTLFHSLHTLFSLPYIFFLTRFHSLHTQFTPTFILSSHSCLTFFTLSSHFLSLSSHSLLLLSFSSHSLRCDKQVRVRRRHHDWRCQGKRARIHLCGYERYEAP
jgi:hypothetical protein